MVQRPIDELAIFRVAFSIESNDFRDQYLHQVCGDDEKLRSRIVELLQASEEAPEFLESFAEIETVNDLEPFAEPPGTWIGRYRLVREIGQGGMGMVYLAVQEEPVKREVALKIIKPGMDTREVVARFEAERQALALMDHQGIAKVLDGGTTESGRPYFVMELVEGTLITDYCNSCRYTNRQRLQLFIQVCEAVQHAHQKGIVHRDIKPTNILVANQDGQVIPRIIDFGIAKVIDQSLTELSYRTHNAQVVGTPLYMSPEQAEGVGQDIDTRSDIYSLGVLLYELLTGTMPFDRERLKTSGLDEFKRVVREEVPPKPSTRLKAENVTTESIADTHSTSVRALAHELAGELDWIVMKALEKDRTRRYESASEFARDVQRYLNDDTVEACPPSRIYRFRKFTRRHRAAIAALSGTIVVLVLGVVVSTCFAGWALKAERTANSETAAAVTAKELAEKAGRLAKTQEVLAREQRDLARQQKEEAVRQQEIARRNLFAAHMQVAQHAWNRGQVARLNDVLFGWYPDDLCGWEWHYLLTCARAELQTCYEVGYVKCAAWSSDGQNVLSTNIDNRMSLWDTRTGEEIQSAKPDTSFFSTMNNLMSASFNSNGKLIAMVRRGTIFGETDRSITIWDIAAQRVICTLRAPTESIRSVAWSPDDSQLASLDKNGHVIVWDMTTREPIQTFARSGTAAPFLAWSPDGKQLATVGRDPSIEIWDVATGQRSRVLDGHSAQTLVAFWSPDGSKLASAGQDKSIKIWDMSTGEETHALHGHSDSVKWVCWSADGRSLASASDDKTVKVWGNTGWRELATFRGHMNGVSWVAWSPDDSRIASISDDRTMKIWDPTRQSPVSLSGNARNVRSVAWKPNGKQLAAVYANGTVKLWEKSTWREAPMFLRQQKVNAIAWSPNGLLLAAVDSTQRTVEVWDTSTQKRVATLQTESREPVMDWSPDGSLFAASYLDRQMRVWDTTAWKEVTTLPKQNAVLNCIDWSPTGRSLIMTDHPQQIGVWDVGTWTKVRSVRGGSSWATWNPDGSQFALQSRASNAWYCEPNIAAITICAQKTGNETLRLRGHEGKDVRATWSPDGSRLATTASDGALKIWDLTTGEELLTFSGITRSPSNAAWSPDGMCLAAACDDGTVKVWDSSPGYEFGGSAGYWRSRAHQLAAAGKYEQAIEAYEQMPKQFPGTPESEIGRALASVYIDRIWSSTFDEPEEMGEFDEILTDLEQAIRLDPNEQTYRRAYEALHVYAIGVHLKAGRLAAATKLFSQLIASPFLSRDEDKTNNTPQNHENENANPAD